MRHFIIPLLATVASVPSMAAAYADLGDQLFKLLPIDGAAGDHFGQSVAISGTTAIVGAVNDDDNGDDSGSAYLFDTTTGQQIVKFLPMDETDGFGSSVAIIGSTTIVGTSSDDENGLDSGAAHLFDISDTANPMRTAKLLANDAPLFTRPFNGVPLDKDEMFIQIVPAELIDSTNDEQRHLDPGGGPCFDPPNLPPRFAEGETTPSPTGMTAGGACFAQFVAHDLTKTRLRFDETLFPPFVFHFMELADGFQNRRTPGFDLDPVYRINPLEWPSMDGELGPWDASNLRFRFGTNEIGGLDFLRQENGEALIGDSRNDVTGIIGQIHRAFMQLHNEQVDRIVVRDEIDEDQLKFLSQQWWDIFNEARNYATAYYQGIVANEYATHLTGRTLFEALDDRVYPLGPLELPQVPLEFSGSVFRLHTLIPTQIQIGPETFVGPVDEELKLGVPWIFLFGPTSPLAGRLDTAVAAPLREIVNLVVPGTRFPITIDLAQINLLRGRELALPSGEEYLAFLLNELGLDPRETACIRDKQILTAKNAAGFLDPVEDADLLADLQNGDTDLWAYIQLEPQLNDGLLGPVGQDILERTWAGLLLGDDWSLVGKFSDQFTPEQMDFFRTATFDRMLDELLILRRLRP